MTYVQTVEKQIAANATKQDIMILSPSKGEKYHIQGIAWKLSGAGYLEVWVETTKVHTLYNTLNADAGHVLPVKIDLDESKKYSWQATDTSGAANTITVMVVFEIETVTK